MKRTALLVTALAVTGADGAQAANQKEMMAKAFLEWCSASIPNWDAMNAKAITEKLPMTEHRKTPLRKKDEFIEEKTWSVEDKRGNYAVDAVHSNLEGKHIASCGINFTDLMDRDLPAYFSKQLKLGKPPSVTPLGDGKQITVWDTAPDVHIMLTSGGVGGYKGAAINRIQTLEPGH